jgi:hypothetical protein
MMCDSEKCPHWIKGWLHVREVRENTSREIWYSPSKDVSAVRRENWIELRDHSSGVYHSFDMNEQLLYRVPEYVPIRQQYYARMVETLDQIVHDEKPPADPLSTMKFLAIKDGIELVSHSLSKIERDGQQCWEYRLTLHHAGTDNSAEYRFNVDPVSRLLQHVYFSGTTDRQPRRF